MVGSKLPPAPASMRTPSTPGPASAKQLTDRRSDAPACAGCSTGLLRGSRKRDAGISIWPSESDQTRQAPDAQQKALLLWKVTNIRQPFAKANSEFARS